MIAGGVGIGLPHQETALEAAARSEFVVLGAGAQQGVRLVFAHLASRANEAMIVALRAAVEGMVPAERPQLKLP